MLSEQRDVLDVLNIRIRSDSSHNRDDVETDFLTDMFEFYVVADGLLQVLQPVSYTHLTLPTIYSV